MAGRTARPTRARARLARNELRLADAETVEEQLAVAFDWFRAAVKHAEGSEQVTRDAAGYLAGLAHQLDSHRTLRRAG